MFTLYRIVFTTPRKSYRIGLLFTLKNGWGGLMSVTEWSCAAPISKMESHISWSDGCSHYIYRIVFAPPRKPYRIGLLFTHENDCGGAISVTERGCTAEKRGAKVDRHIGDKFLAILWCSVNNYSAHRRSKWVAARTATHWYGSKYLRVRTVTMFRCVWTTCATPGRYYSYHTG